MGDVRVPDLNVTMIAGRLTRDPELKYTQSGRAVCTISVANSQFYKDKSGERKENTTFVDATLWDKPAEWIGQNMTKGRPVIVEGRLKSESWEDKQTGQKRSKLTISAIRVTPLDWDQKPENSGGGGSRSEGGSRSYSQPDHGYDDGGPIPEDDIPF